MKWATILILIILAAPLVSAYKESVPVSFEEDYFDQWDQKFIENKEFTNDEGDCVYIKESEWVVLRGNYIHDCNPETDLRSDGYAMHIIDVEHLVIENNLFEDNFRGIYLENVKHVVIKNNEVRGTNRDVATKIEAGEDIQITDNTLENNGVTDIEMSVAEQNRGKEGILIDGIEIVDADDVVISGNTVSGSTGSGIWISGFFEDDVEQKSTNYEIYGNTVSDNAQDGIFIEGVETGEIYTNTLQGQESGIVLNNAVVGLEVRDNTISENSGCGVVIRLSRDNTILSNQITKNEDGGVCLDGTPEDMTITSNINVKNKIETNDLSENAGGNIRIISSSNENTEVIGNTFDTIEKNSIFSRGSDDWKDELIVGKNNYVEEGTPEPELISEEPEEDIVEGPSETVEDEFNLEEDGDRVTLSDAEEIKQEDVDPTPIVAYALLTLFFVLIVVGIVLVGIRLANRNK